jgi:hypothetical protein
LPVSLLASQQFHMEGSWHTEDTPLRFTNNKHQVTPYLSCSHMMMMMMTQYLPASLVT